MFPYFSLNRSQAVYASFPLKVAKYLQSHE
jgi:hypothetical protein